jgi:hypothetical protein
MSFETVFALMFLIPVAGLLIYNQIQVWHDEE